MSVKLVSFDSPNPSLFNGKYIMRALSSFAPVLRHVIQFPGFSPFGPERSKFSTAGSFMQTVLDF